MQKLLTAWLITSFLAGFFVTGVSAQQEGAEPEAPVAEAAPEDALNRGTPRGSAIGFLEACASFDFEKAAEYLDLRNLPGEVAEIGGHELARQLNHVISRTVWLDDYSVSDSPEGAQGDGLPGYRDQLVVVKIPEGEFPIWLQRVPRGDGERIWKISNRSVALIPDLYDELSYPEWVERIRQFFPEDASFLGLEAFKWFIGIGMGFLAWPLLWVLGWLLSRLFSSPERPAYVYWRKLFKGPFVFIGILVVMGFALERLGMGVYAQEVSNAKTLTIIALIWFFWVSIDLFRAFQQNRLIENNRPGAAKVLRPITGLIKLVVLVFGSLFWLNNIGVNITTLLAGLGVGGLAVALALQKPLEDMMGALTIFSQATLRVGDFVRYGEITGTVEDIGLRTTKVRTLTNTVVSIPNSRIAYVEVENLSLREKIRFWPTLRLRYDTTQKQLQEVRDNIWTLLSENDEVHDDPVRVRFTDFDKDAILLKVHCFLKTTDFTESLRIGEELNYRIMGIVEEAGAKFALPGTTMYIEGDGSALQT
ncbi:MAG: mechanosensitive ion channel family protein [Gammaproteobacteria bacterium]|nr:mechanosensitive ion channel family protein [Gammaproteobacteria bacterium]